MLVHINELVELSVNAGLEIPRTDCVLSNEGSEARPSLVWEKGRIALLLHDGAEEFFDVFGERYQCSSNWSLILVGDGSSPHQLVSMLRERVDG